MVQKIMGRGHDDYAEDEPIRGLPERLPKGEHILWQGAPEWKSLALSAFYVGFVLVYFFVLMVWRGWAAFETYGDTKAAVLIGLSPMPLALTGAGLLAFVAWLSSRTTLYTITNRRVVFRIGIALPNTINVPFRSIASASLRIRFAQTGDIPLELRGPDRIGFVHLWPHVRPWKLRIPHPMLRSVPDASAVAQILAGALREFSAQQSSSQISPEPLEQRSEKVARALGAVSAVV
jgi:hypothetical protein